jgi:hypothetical protein
MAQRKGTFHPAGAVSDGIGDTYQRAYCCACLRVARSALRRGHAIYAMTRQLVRSMVTINWYPHQSLWHGGQCYFYII